MSLVFDFFGKLFIKAPKNALTYGTIYRSSLIRRAGDKFLACLVPDMNPTARVAGERAARNGLVLIEIK